ncbi:hypothetical protein Tco_1110326 [Tanacetum coccineum]|uniref:Uncharacterized protein n=1 Tax=Tanacetum coccineum TaxID=301880 RepID=A0ABQ5IKL2_9ASTR
MLIKRVTIPVSLLKSFYISGLKLALQCALLRSNPTTLDEAFSLAHAAETRFTNQQLWERLRSYPLTLGEAFFRAHITEARFEDENNQAVDTNVDQQVSEVDDDTNNDDFDYSLPPHKGVILTVEEVVFDNTTSDLKKDKDEQGKIKKKGVITFFEVGANKDNNPNGVFNDGGEVGYNKADGTWVPTLRIEDGWYLFNGLD